MNLKPDHSFVFQDVDNIYVLHRSGFLLCPKVACSYAYATFRIDSSSKCFPINCSPIGRLFELNPHGIEMPGTPAKFTEIVKISDRYIWSGSAVFSPILNAAVGEVGVTITSAF